jgi:hypothetical protein
MRLSRCASNTTSNLQSPALMGAEHFLPCIMQMRLRCTTPGMGNFGAGGHFGTTRNWLPGTASFSETPT